jgi:hypothetical protein
MQRHKSVITFIDFLMILAILLIAAGIFVPHFARKSAATDGAQAKNPAPISRPLR